MDNDVEGWNKKHVFWRQNAFKHPVSFNNTDNFFFLLPSCPLSGNWYSSFYQCLFLCFWFFVVKSPAIFSTIIITTIVFSGRRTAVIGGSSPTSKCEKRAKIYSFPEKINSIYVCADRHNVLYCYYYFYCSYYQYYFFRRRRSPLLEDILLCLALPMWGVCPG